MVPEGHDLCQKHYFKPNFPFPSHGSSPTLQHGPWHWVLDDSLCPPRLWWGPPMQAKGNVASVSNAFSLYVQEWTIQKKCAPFPLLNHKIWQEERWRREKRELWVTLKAVEWSTLKIQRNSSSLGHTLTPGLYQLNKGLFAEEPEWWLSWHHHSCHLLLWRPLLRSKAGPAAAAWWSGSVPGCQ